MHFVCCPQVKGHQLGALHNTFAYWRERERVNRRLRQWLFGTVNSFGFLLPVCFGGFIQEQAVGMWEAALGGVADEAPRAWPDEIASIEGFPGVPA